MGARPFHPGELVLISLIGDAAGRMHVPYDDLEAIVECREPVTPEMAERLGALFGNGPDIWLRLQSKFDIKTTTQTGETK